MALLVHLVPLALVLGFFAVGVGLRSWLQLRRHGTLGIVLFRDGRMGHLLDAALLLLPLALLWQAAAEWLAPDWLAALWLPLTAAAGLWLRAAGTLVVLASTALMFLAQLSLGASWRVGIDRESRHGLIVAGAYRVCRNPIFTCMLLALLGFALVQPTYLSLALTAATFLGIRLQVIEEERYLAQTYGQSYEQYAAHVGRFVPGIGLRSF